MKLNRAVLTGMVMTAVTALLFIGGCTSMSTRADLHVDSVNDGKTYYSDLINEADSLHPFIPVDQVTVKSATCSTTAAHRWRWARASTRSSWITTR